MTYALTYTPTDPNVEVALDVQVTSAHPADAVEECSGIWVDTFEHLQHKRAHTNMYCCNFSLISTQTFLKPSKHFLLACQDAAGLAASTMVAGNATVKASLQLAVYIFKCFRLAIYIIIII